MKCRPCFLGVVLALAMPPMSLVAAKAPSPSEFLSFTVGGDRKLADYRQITSYFKALEASSPRVKLQVLGKTTLGEDMFLAVISSEENIRNLKAIKETSRKLSDPRELSDGDLAALEQDGKLILLITCNIHASEIGASQMAMEWAHALATAEDAETLRRLKNVVLLLMPSLNPDGQIMETDWYRKNLGTKFEGSRMPWLYHHYVGHDNNRDWYMLTQKETRALNAAVYREWFPQVWLDEHQMGSNGPRIFMPPYAEPVSADIHPLVWREVNLIGSTMALRLEQLGKTGVIYGYSFDAYWPGGTKNTGWWKNISGLLTEVASARLATPVFLPPGELAGGQKGLVEYRAQTNFPNPWPGGWWRLRDIMDYERVVSDAILETCADRREDFLKDMVARARAAIATFGPKDAYRIPMDDKEQRDRPTALLLARLMAEHNVDVKTAANGDVFIPLAQPYGKFVREMFEAQHYPEVKLVPGKDIVRPYDVSAWTLPLMLGVAVEKTIITESLTAFTGKLPAGAAASTKAGATSYAVAPDSPENAKAINAALRSKGNVQRAQSTIFLEGKTWPAGTWFLDAAAARAAEPAALDAGVSLYSLSKNPPSVSSSSPGSLGSATPPVALVSLHVPRVGLYKPWAASMDEGWTRWILEQYGFDPKSIDNKTIRAGKLNEALDVLVLPSVGSEVIATGKPRREDGEMKYFPELPPDYAGGLEKEGSKALRDFVEGGGTLVALASSTEYVLAEFNVPVRNVIARAKRDDFSSAGSLLKVEVESGHPVTWGLPPTTAVFLDDAVAFQTTLPGAEMERWILASYPAEPRDILLSGWIHGEEKLAQRAAAVAMTYGKGKIVLLGFRAQQRAQTHATFPFLFNALWWSVEGGASR